MTEIPKHLRKRLVPPVYLLIWAVAMKVLDTYEPVGIEIESPYTWLGLPVLLFGLALAIMANRSFVLNETALRPFTKSTALVQTGVFKFTRNPMYLGMTLVLLGAGMLQGSWSALMAVPLFPVLIDWLFIRKEEELLKETFGKAYLDYRQKVRRWL